MCSVMPRIRYPEVAIDLADHIIPTLVIILFDDDPENGNQDHFVMQTHAFLFVCLFVSSS